MTPTGQLVVGGVGGAAQVHQSVLVGVPPSEAEVDAADEGGGLVHHDGLLVVCPHLGGGDVVRVADDPEDES